MTGRFIFRFNWTRPTSWKDLASNLDEWEAWDRAQRRRYGWRAGLRFWSKTNQPRSRVLLARHWPHRLCWSWSLWVGVHDSSSDNWASVVVAREYRFAHIHLWRLYARFSWQDSDHMPSSGRARVTCPEIYWRHHLEHAEVAGSA